MWGLLHHQLTRRAWGGEGGQPLHAPQVGFQRRNWALPAQQAEGVQDGGVGQQVACDARLAHDV